MVRAMQQEMKENIANWENEDEVAAYIERIIRKEAFDKTGLVYGMGHAVYTLSDPRAVICKQFAKDLAKGTEREAEYKLLEIIERLTPQVFEQVKGHSKDLCANIDMYSGFVYKTLDIPVELYTPLFAAARIAGWIAHRIEEVCGNSRIIRPAYRVVYDKRKYVPRTDR